MTSQLFQCLGDLNLNQRRLEQDPGLEGPVGGLRRVFTRLKIIIFLFVNCIHKHSRMIRGNIFEDYMEAGDQIQRKFLNNGSFYACPGLKGPLSPDEG